MGYRKKANEAIKDVEQTKEQEKVSGFIAKIKEISDEFGLQIVPVIDKYGPKWEVQKLPENKETRIK